MSFICWDEFQENSWNNSGIRQLHVQQNNFVRQLAKVLGLLFVFCSLTQSAMALTLLQTSSKGVSFQLNKVADGLGVPWGMVFIGPDQILFTERNGKIGILDTASGVITGISGGPKVMHSGQGGLLDVAVPPDFVPGDWIYFSYSKEKNGKGVIVLV